MRPNTIQKTDAEIDLADVVVAEVEIDQRPRTVSGDLIRAEATAADAG